MSDPALIGAFAAVFTALATLITAVGILIQMLRKNTATTVETNKLVNSTADLNIARLDQLTQALQNNGIPLPVDPAVAIIQKRIEEHPS